MATKRKIARKPKLAPLPEVAPTYPSFYDSIVPPRSPAHDFVSSALDLFVRTTKEEARAKGLDEAADTMLDWAVGHFKAKDDRSAYALRECAAHVEKTSNEIYSARVSPYTGLNGNSRQIVETALLMLTPEQLAQLRERFLAVI